MVTWLRVFLLSTALPCVAFATLDESPEARWDPKEQKGADLEVKTIGTGGDGEVTLAEALDLVARETGNPINRAKIPTAAGKKTPGLEGLTFWESIRTIEKAWALSPDQLRPVWNQGVSPPKPLSDPTILETTEGLFRITVSIGAEGTRRAGGTFRKGWVQIESEPRLPCFAAVESSGRTYNRKGQYTAQDGRDLMNYRWANLTRLPITIVGDVKSIQITWKLLFYHTWESKRAGALSKLKVEKVKKGKVEYYFEGIKDIVGQQGRSIRVSLWDRTSLLDSSDLRLRLPDGAFLKPDGDTPSSRVIFHGVPRDASLSKIGLFIRVPKRTKTLALTLKRDLED